MARYGKERRPRYSICQRCLQSVYARTVRARHIDVINVPACRGSPARSFSASSMSNSALSRHCSNRYISTPTSRFTASRGSPCNRRNTNSRFRRALQRRFGPNGPCFSDADCWIIGGIMEIIGDIHDR